MTSILRSSWITRTPMTLSQAFSGSRWTRRVGELRSWQTVSMSSTWRITIGRCRMSEQQTPMTAIARTDEFRAVWTLNRMREIVLNEMLMHGEYSTAVVDERRAEEGAVCGGRRACAVGSLWIAYGVPFDEYG